MKGKPKMTGIKKLFFQNLANAITVFGLLMAIWALVLTINEPEQLWLIFLLSGVVVLTDIIDGWTARKYENTSGLGSLLDRIRDRVFIYPALVILTWHYHWKLTNLPNITTTFIKALVILIILIEILFIIALCIGFVKKLDLGVNKWGKRKTFCEFTAVLVWLFSLTVEKYFGFPLIKFLIYFIALALVLTIYWSVKALEDYYTRIPK